MKILFDHNKSGQQNLQDIRTKNEYNQQSLMQSASIPQSYLNWNYGMSTNTNLVQYGTAQQFRIPTYNGIKME